MITPDSLPVNLADLDLSGKTVLETGSGRGAASRSLAALLSRHPGSHLVVTDISDASFDRLRQELAGYPITLEFIQTPAEQLQGIPDGSVDVVVCSYTLCAIETQPGRAARALERFCQVLKTGGLLLVEEEFPLEKAANPHQDLWAEKWRLLRAAQQASGQPPYRELDPHDLSSLCRLLGFEQVCWQASTARLLPEEFLPFFQERFTRLAPSLPLDSLQAGFSEWAARLHARAMQLGGMEIPYYRLSARKGWVHPKHISAACALITDQSGRVLMLRHHQRGWEIPGGQVEEGESLPDALAREVLEETGIAIRIDRLAGVYSNLKPPVKLIFGFLGQAVSGSLTTSPESPETAWVGRSDVLARLTHPAVYDRVKDLLEFDGRVVYRVYTTNPYQVVEVRSI
jgi:8-oxo-dGTP pyrophosphatase MutT (NUDIX family)/phospholipid N-methyltransferase